MKKLSLFVLLIVFNSNYLFSQKETYIGIGGLFASNDMYDFSDNGSLIKEVDYNYFRIEAPEIFIGRQISKQLYIELAYKAKSYYIGYKHNPEFDQLDSYLKFLKTYQFPFRLKYKQNICNKIIITPYLGFIFGINKSYKSYGESMRSGNNFTTSSKYLANYRKNFVLAHMGFDFEFILNNKHSVLLNFGYVKGFKDLVTQRIDYFTWGEPWNLAKIIGKGDYMSFGVSYKYSFNRNQL